MKRAFGNSHGSVDEEAKARLKHQNLLDEFLELQKEFVAKKKKLETIKKMRGTLSNEVRFLRRRYNYLRMIKSREYKPRQDFVRSQDPYPQSKMAKKYGVNESVSRRQDSLPDSDQDMVRAEGDARSRVDVRVVSGEEKKPHNNLINGKRVGKKKISWHDPLVLEAI